MPKTDSSLMMLAVAALVALGVGYYVPRTFSSSRAQIETPTAQAKAGTPATTGATTTASPGKPAARNGAWVASGPGRIEPSSGEIRVGAQAAGRVAEVLVGVNDKVHAGDLMVRLDDDDQQARILALSAEVSVRKRERDAAELSQGNLARERRTAEDNLSSAERGLYLAREELDRVMRARTADEIEKARDAVTKARDKVEQTRAALRKALAADGLPAPSRGEVALTAARAELSAAEAALERTRVRAPLTGTVLSMNARVGEVMAPSPELAVAVVGSLSQLRVRAEFEERDLGKVREGQAAVVRSDAFQSRDFEGVVTSVSPSLAASKIGQRGPRKMNDVDVLEVLINLTGQTPLLPGMRVDVFLKHDAQASAEQPAKAN